MQSDIFKYAINCITDTLKTNADGHFSVTADFTKTEKPQVRINVIDIFQSSNDKTGQKIIVDEKLYEVPAQYVLMVRISFAGAAMEEVLSAYGFVATYFKDHNSFDLGEFNWHGNTTSKFFLEPVIRREFSDKTDYLHLDYKIELQLNSVKPEKFARVEKKVLNANQIK